VRNKALIEWAETQPIPVQVLTNKLVCSAYYAGRLEGIREAIAAMPPKKDPPRRSFAEGGHNDEWETGVDEGWNNYERRARAALTAKMEERHADGS